MNIGSQRILAWMGPLSLLVFFVGFWPLAQFIPPLSPSSNATEISAYFREHSTGIRVNGVLMLLSASMLTCFYAEISVQLKRIEGEVSPMAYAQLITGVLAVVPFVPVAVAWCAAAFRAERSDELVYLLSDYGWIMLFMVGAPALLQFIVIGIAVMCDKRTNPILPRWYAYFTFASALLGDIPGWLVVFFKRGPFSWEGLVSFWIPVVVFGVWTLGTAIVILKAIAAQERAQ